MSSEPNPEPDERGPVIYVGHDKAGHWLVQDRDRRIEGRFVSRGAALSFAHEERELYHGRVELAPIALVPTIPFGPVDDDARALSRAA